MKRESGQVLLAGVIMVTVLLLAVLYMFDVHNVIRGKLKMETGQQAAALTGAAWQRNSLNLIGDINIFIPRGARCDIPLRGVIYRAGRDAIYRFAV